MSLRSDTLQRDGAVTEPCDPLLRRPLHRRRFLAAGAALAASAVPYRVLGQTSQPDVVVIGAGAAGIAAARRLAEAGVSYALIEAAKRVGGRALTDSSVFGVPFDMGANRLRFPEAGPLSRLGRASGFDVARGPEAGRLYLGGSEAGDGEYDDFLAAVRQTQRAVISVGEEGRDLPAAQVLPKLDRSLAPWAASGRFVAGPFQHAKDLEHVSTLDVAHAEPWGVDDVCRQGLGALVASLAAPLTVQFDTAATAVRFGGRRMVVDTSRGGLQPRFVIVAVPPGLVSTGRLRILPRLPPRQAEAMERISLGAYDHIAFEWPGAPASLAANEVIYFRTGSEAGYALQARLGGRNLFSLEVGGRLAEELADAPPKVVRGFLDDAITREFGADAARRIGRTFHTRWTKEPLALGAWSCAGPGAGHMRRAFLEVVAGRLAFAGEHAHEHLFGTVTGAWLSGERAAEQAITALGGRPG